MNLKDEFIKYFVAHGHIEIPSAPLIPENDPTVLFNTAGMQPLIPYLLGEPHPKGKRLCDAQKCVRLTDLESIGDKTHHTFFEMLGNWSLGDYFKKESIGYSFEFLTKVLNIPIERLAITVFKGNDSIPRDEVSASIWQDLGIPKERIAYLGEEDNFWIAGESGPCGGDTEIFYFRSNEEIPKNFDPNDDRWVEIWNNVFMEYYKHADGKYTKLEQKNVDTGLGLERMTMLLQGKETPYDTELFEPIMKKLEELQKIDSIQSRRIVAEHLRSSMMIIADGGRPSNIDRGYVLRRLIRRMIRHLNKLQISLDEISTLIAINVENLKGMYPELEKNQATIQEVLLEEKNKFVKTLAHGEREFNKEMQKAKQAGTNVINGQVVFRLYDTYGFPPEVTKELAEENGFQIDLEEFEKLFKQHQEKSRAGSEHKFKGGLADQTEETIAYHTATHLLNAALKQIIGKDAHQRGSNITAERMRFDFNCDHKLTEEEKKAVEDLVNKWIQEGIPVTKQEMSKEEAIKSGAECMFIEKYPDIVTVYSIGDVSKELCGGPHVSNTNELGRFKIKKEESSSSGIRRIKAVLIKE